MYMPVEPLLVQPVYTRHKGTVKWNKGPITE